MRAAQASMESILHEAGAQEVMTIDRTHISSAVPGWPPGSPTGWRYHASFPKHLPQMRFRHDGHRPGDRRNRHGMLPVPHRSGRSGRHAQLGCDDGRHRHRDGGSVGSAESIRGSGWSYSTGAAARVITEHLEPAIAGQDAFDIPGCWSAMHRACRNLGPRGLVMQAISAVDIALWDLKARARCLTDPVVRAGRAVGSRSTGPADSPAFPTSNSPVRYSFGPMPHAER